MSYTEAQLRELFEQADAMPYGPGRIALMEQVAAHADPEQLPALAFAARLELTGSYMTLGQPTRGLVTFAWCVAEFDRDPIAYAEHQESLLWEYKHAIGALTRSPEIPLDQTYAALDDMERRFRDTGHSPHAVYSHRHRVAGHVGDLDTAERYYLQWCAAPRDSLSDCAACDPERKLRWESLRGRDEEAVALAEPVLSRRDTCRGQPQDILTALLVPYVRTGRLDEARDAHRRAYRTHGRRVEDLDSVAEHIAFCARTGNEARALELVQRHIDWLDRASSPWVDMMFSASCALALRRAQSLSSGQVLVTRGPAADPVAASALADELTDRAISIATRFDERNGTAHVGNQVRELLEAPPLIDQLPLSASSASRTTPPPSPVDSANAPTVAKPQALPGLGKAQPSPLDALIEAVADRTAHGDADAAADARHALAEAYLRADRPLDAAEVAEEELAYRLGAGQPDALHGTRALLATAYERLDEVPEALAQLEAIGAELDDDDRPAIATVAHRMGRLLDRLDRDAEAADRFLVAAGACADVGWAADEVDNRRRHALSLYWAYGLERAVPALEAAEALGGRLVDGPAEPADDEVAWAVGQLAYDGARLLWQSDELAGAAERAERAAAMAARVGKAPAAAGARLLLAQILHDAAAGERAETAARAALEGLTEPDDRLASVEILDAALRRQGRDAEADQVWAEFDVNRPDRF